MSQRFRPRLWMLLVVVAVLASAIEFLGIGPRWRAYRRETSESEITVRSCSSLYRDNMAEAERLRAAAKHSDPTRAAVLLASAEEAEDKAYAWKQLQQWNERRIEIFREASRHPWQSPPRMPTFVQRTRTKSVLGRR